MSRGSTFTVKPFTRDYNNHEALFHHQHLKIYAKLLFS